MAWSERNDRELKEESPSSLLPMLISGLVLTVIGMLAVAAFA
jgi:hypothetical protein